MLKSILISTVMLLFVTGVIFSQTDSQQKSGLKNSVTTEKPIPQYLLDQLEMAQRTENIVEEKWIMNILIRNILMLHFIIHLLPTMLL